jgi:hypothetical protein
MPDFLSKAPAAPSPAAHHTPPQAPSSAAPTVAASTPWSSNKEVAYRLEETDGATAPVKMRKPPSRLFTDYYASLFLLLVTVALTTGFWLLRPLVMRYRMEQGNINNIRAQLSDEQDYLESLRQSIVAAETIPAETLSDVEEALPRAPDVPKLLVMMSTLAKVNNVVLSNVQFTVSRTAETDGALGGVDTVDIGMSVSSQGYAGTRRYLGALERNLRLLDLDTISFQPSGNSTDDDGNWNYGLQLKAYSLPQRSFSQ